MIDDMIQVNQMTHWSKDLFIVLSLHSFVISKIINILVAAEYTGLSRDRIAHR